MKHLILIILVSCCACSCSENDSQKQANSAPAEQTHADPHRAEQTSAKPEVAPALLTQQNHEDILTQYWNSNAERKVRLITNKGHIDIRLFEETPVHSSTFLYLVKKNYLEETLFTRVVPGFIIQGGSSDSEELSMKNMRIGSFNPKPEFRPHLIHRRGAVSMARQYDDNPEKLSSPFNFFIVVGRTFNTPQLMAMERDHNKTFSEQHRSVYERVGGAPHLDGDHTVFGEVIAGMDVVDAISNVETDSREWPVEDIKIEAVELLP